MPYGNNRELITLVEAISGSSDYIPLMVIIAAKTILEKWCDQLLAGLPYPYNREWLLYGCYMPRLY